MLATGHDIVSFLEELAPDRYALPGDPTGLQWGDLSREIGTVLLALDFSDAVLDEAFQAGAGFVFTHHPYLFSPVSSLDYSRPRERLLARAVKADVTLYSAHTNLDTAPAGVNQVLGELFGLKDMDLLWEAGSEALEKLVVFVPQGYEDEVREAISQAGAGWIGNYSHCTYQLLGTGTFLPREGTTPFVGQEGALEKVTEFRLETIMPRRIRSRVLTALFNAHPYEEVAYDLYPLENPGDSWGLGRVGRLEKPVPLEQLVQEARRVLDPGGALRFLGDPGQMVEKVALLGGSGGSYIDRAVESGAQVYITGDIKYHEAQRAADAGLALIDAGHEATERPVLAAVARGLSQWLQQRNYGTAVRVSEQKYINWNPEGAG